jgi:RNA polymerase sigma factor (sigma-70 family)
MGFPSTRHSAIRGLDDTDESIRKRSHEAVVQTYWSPIHKYLRLQWRESSEDAADLTQAFFARSLEAGTLSSYNAGKGTFRTYLRTCLDRFVLNARKREARTQAVTLDFDVADEGQSPEELFHREWVRSLFTFALEDLRGRHQDTRFQLFEKYDLNESEKRPTYGELAEEFGISVVSVTNFLAAMRRDFRRAVRDRLRDLTISEREFESELRAIFTKT